MTEHEDLIARLRNRSGVQTEDVNERVKLMDEAADALEKVTAERDAARRRNAELTRSSNEKNDTIDALVAVVERAKGWATMRVPGFTVENQMAEVADALNAAPEVALDRVKAEALREAADAFEGGTISVEIFGDSAEAQYWNGVNDARGNLVASMRERADHIEKGESND